MSVQTLLELWQTNILILPEIQREYVWDNGRASRLIESLLLNIPIPVLYFAETRDAKYEIIDGHQRVRSIIRYVTNEFALSGLWVLDEYQRLRLHQLPEKEQRFLKMRVIRAVIISRDSHPNIKFEVFERLNSGSITLNSQEMRNSLFRGTFNRMLHNLVSDDRLRNLIGTKTPRKRMVDQELLLRFFALRERLGDYRAPLKRFLNEFMHSVQEADEQKIADYRELFNATMVKLEALLGDRAFRVCDEQGRPLERTVNRALFDAQMLAASWVSNEPPFSDSVVDSLKAQLARLYLDQDFLDSIQKATGNTSNTRRRIEMMVTAFSESGLTLNAPYVLNN
jgi:hypothetical protein